MALPTETQEWLDQLVAKWTEVHKKSMTTLVLLHVIRDSAPANADTIGPDFTDRTGWSLTERGLYRTLRRLTADGLLAAEEEDAPRTGAKRKNYSLTQLGADFLRRAEEAQVTLSS